MVFETGSGSRATGSGSGRQEVFILDQASDWLKVEASQSEATGGYWGIPLSLWVYKLL